jgi:hypothetical protein
LADGAVHATRPQADKRFHGMDIKSWAARVKDAAVQQVAKWLANRYHLKRLGRITDLQLDSTEQRIFLVLALHGEKDVIELTLTYRILSPEMLEIGEVQASRPWMTEFINKMIPAEQKRLAVPSTVTRILAPARTG